MVDDVASPSPHQINDNPELAILAALAHTLLMTRHGLLAAHPVLMSPDDPDDHDTAAWIASQVSSLAILLGDTVDAYRNIVGCTLRRNEVRDDADEF